MATKTSKLKTKKVIDGVDESAKPLAQTINDILNGTKVSHFKTSDRNEFSAKLDEMSLADMQLLASKVEVLPVHNRKALKEKLLKQFDAKASRRTSSPFANYGMPGSTTFKSAENEAKIKAVLDRGK